VTIRELTPCHRHFKAIQDYPSDWYQQFNLIIAGLDSIKARRWINATLVSLAEKDEEGNWDMDTIIPLVDGGTEGFKGQSRVILPRITSCFECSLDLFPADPLNFPICTLASTPRQPEHCIEYITVQVWDQERPGEKLDKDNAEHMLWVFQRAQERAEKFGINGVTLRLTQGVVKRIIPAIASTNAVIAASCVHEIFKIATRTGGYLDNYMMYNGGEGVFTNTFVFEKKASCPVCGGEPMTLQFSSKATLQEVIDELVGHPNLQLTGPSVSTGSDGTKKNLYMRNPKPLEAATRPNLSKALDELIKDGDYLYITDPQLPSAHIEVKVEFSS
jgi:ubiquitin-activating enzyme E1 C